MGNGLNEIKDGGALVSAIEKQGIDQLLQPLIKEIHLFDTYIAGTSHLKDKSVLDEIREEDKLILRREDNKFDSNAILILTSGKKKLGYVPEKDNIVFARLMDAGKALSARVISVTKYEHYARIEIGIYLIDF